MSGWFCPKCMRGDNTPKLPKCEDDACPMGANRSQFFMPMKSATDIVGHKTFDTGETDPETGFPKLRHEPLTRAEADAMMDAADKAKVARAERMPDEQSAIRALFDAWLRLKELGWREPMYCPKDGTRFRIIELGSTGIFEGAYEGTWPDGHWLSWDDCDSYCSSIAPAMYRLFPADEEKKKQRWAEAGKKFRATLSQQSGEG